MYVINMNRFKFKEMIEQLKNGIKCYRCGSIWVHKNGRYELRRKHKILNKKYIQTYYCVDCGLHFSETRIVIETEDFVKGLVKHMGLTEREARQHVEATRESDVAEFVKAYKPLVVNGKIRYLGKMSKDYQKQKEYWKQHGKKSETFEQKFKVKGKLGKTFEEVLTK